MEVADEMSASAPIAPKLGCWMSRLRPPPEHHFVNRIGWLRAAVLGANDGIISTASLIVGVAAAAGKVDLTLAEEALRAISRKAIERKTGARGLRSIMESILLDTMFELQSLEGVEEVVISKQVVEGTAPPLYIYADRSDRTGDASA